MCAPAEEAKNSDRLFLNITRTIETLGREGNSGVNEETRAGHQNPLLNGYIREDKCHPLMPPLFFLMYVV